MKAPERGNRTRRDSGGRVQVTAPPHLGVEAAEVHARSPWTVHGSTLGRFAVGVAMIAGSVLALRVVSIGLPPCPLRTVTGVPCPGCGLTHLALDLVHARVARVLTHDPAGVLLAGVLAVVVIAQVRAVRNRDTGPRWLSSRLAVVVVVALIATHWATTIVTGGMLSA